MLESAGPPAASPETQGRIKGFRSQMSQKGPRVVAFEPLLSRAEHRTVSDPSFSDTRMSRAGTLAQIVTLLGVTSWPIYAQESPSGATTTDQPSTVLFVVDSKAADSTQARAAHLLSLSRPVSEWPTLRLKTPANISDLAGKYYGYAVATYPTTNLEIATLIVRANGLQTNSAPTGSLLHLPPIPVRPLARVAPALLFGRSVSSIPAYEDFNQRSGAYVPAQTEYEFSTNAAPKWAGSKWKDLDVTTEDARELSVAHYAWGGVGAIADANDLATFNAGRFTTVPLEANAEQLAYSVNNATQATVAHEEETATGCTDGADWLTASPYYPGLAERIHSLTPAERSALESRADQEPLVIVDWNFNGQPGSHGSEVLSVAHYTIASVGLSSLAPRIKTYSVIPSTRSDRDSLLAALRAYRESLYKRSGTHLPPTVDISGAFDRAERWINEYQQPAGAAASQVQVHELVLAAVFYRLMAARPGWINISFDTRSDVIAILTPSQLADGSAFGVVAAGNDISVTARTVPQNQAAQSPFLVNATNGRPPSDVRGSYSGFHLPVSIVGPGCGFSYEAIHPEVEGSSFAAPYVATVSWLKHLMDGTPAAEMRPTLIAASRVAGRMDHPVESAGFLDPALLLTASGPSYVSPDGKAHFPKKLLFEYTLVDTDGELRSATYSNATASHTRPDIAIYPCAAKTCITVRRFGHESEDRDNTELDRGVLKSCRLVQTNEGGAVTTTSGLSAVVAEVREVAF
jgi:hypothetical protein